MKQKKRSFLQKLRGVFKTQLKPYLVDEKYKVVPAFNLGGVDYWMFDSTIEVPTGRMFAALTVYDEIQRGADNKYLIDHCDAVDKVCEDPKKISIKNVIILNKHLRERAELKYFPDYIYKLASVIFFDKSEALHHYDYEYNIEKIKKWKAAGGTLDFFSQTPLKELVPSLNMPEKDSRTYLTTISLISEIHQQHLTDILLEKI